MKRMTIFLLLFEMACRSSATPGGSAGGTFPLAPEAARNFRVTFDEQFDQPIAVRDEIDAPGQSGGRWNQRYWYGAPGWFSSHDDNTVNTVTSLAWAGDDVHRQSDGIMTLAAERRPRDDPAKYGNRPYIGAILQTHGSFAQRYGYFEARLRTTAYPGFWPAFWLWCDKDGGEIDIAEFQTRELNHVYASTHQRTRFEASRAAYLPIKQVDSTEQVAPWGFKINEWHTYGLYWTEAALVWLVDGEEVRRISSHSFHQPCFLILSNGQGGWSDDNKVVTRFPGTFDVDYVRVGAAP